VLLGTVTRMYLLARCGYLGDTHGETAGIECRDTDTGIYMRARSTGLLRARSSVDLWSTDPTAVYRACA
jgi:hypothetical protein